MDIEISSLTELFWSWGTYIQTISVLLLAVFFAVLARQVRSATVQTWAAAWAANLLGLAVASLFWLALGRNAAITWLSFSAYVFFKSAFVLLFVHGTLALIGGAERPGRRFWIVLAGAAGLVAGPLALYGMFFAAALQNLIILLGFGALAAHMTTRHLRGSRWLALGLGLRGLLAAGELFGNLAQEFGWAVRNTPHFDTFMGISSSLDSAAEFLIALASLLLLYEFLQRELRAGNVMLQRTRARLQELLRRDPLTGLLNRHALMGDAEEALALGNATLLFLDIDHFKHINDAFGHQVGDASLVRVAAALKRNFRDGERLVRYAGDEFIVIARGMSAARMRARVEVVRAELAATADEAGPGLAFSVGIAEQAPGQDLDALIRAADQAMYANKRDRS